MEWRRAMQPQRFQVVGSSVAFMAREAVLRIDGVPFFHASVAVGLREDGGGGDGHAARITFDERLLLDEHIEPHGVNQQVIRLQGELLQSGAHGLAAGLINVPRINALGINFGYGPGPGVLANAFGEFTAALSGELFRIIEANYAAFGIEDYGGGNNGAKERAAAGFIETRDAHPA